MAETEAPFTIARRLVDILGWSVDTARSSHLLRAISIDRNAIIQIL